jgi:hypothetical protein
MTFKAGVLERLVEHGGQASAGAAQFHRRICFTTESALLAWGMSSWPTVGDGQGLG